ncbi:nuclear transport factor 2 family protein [Acidovorax sp. NCPPB 3859]|nr:MULTISPECIES: nuclear transport factor 2 family protein [unclassified Acidovorax]MDA8449451.1 nuclear transport factor 2 family protein [Acidovorax sp. GBBC 3297]MDA8458460.1 nuclear transport factor 2 family protein [Acidovorax sp. GBBC 3333]MDA8463498.1 nuclear transport factor 2 family protein [Acidovorax sp. GBBC 3332]MDA8468631.1 nuclear transport factor 2 family protein [Acidovorax sp. GBBC 3299]WCM76987.1 nuclear transport factor 2 family protein [Acidovorax sp. GBBC 712]
MYSDDTALLAHLQALETELHLPATRRDAARLDALLHGDFGEIGRSGVAYTKADVLAQLSLEAAHADIVAGGI